VNPAVTLGLGAQAAFPGRYVPAYLAASSAGLIAQQRAFATQMLRTTNAGHDTIADAAAATESRPGPTSLTTTDVPGPHCHRHVHWGRRGPLIVRLLWRDGLS